jgi:hypothetical protein
MHGAQVNGSELLDDTGAAELRDRQPESLVKSSAARS